MAARPVRRSPLLARLEAGAPGGPQSAIVQELRRVILAGEAPPGSPIPVDEVAALFGVSRIPIRESLKTLIGEGLVDHRQGHGYTVSQITLEELQELYVVRGVLESAALSSSVLLAGPADDQLLEQAYADLDRAVHADDHAAYHRESRRFHLALLAPARMQRLQHMLESAWNLTEPYRPMAHISEFDREQLHSEHRDMLAAFLSRDVVALTGHAGHHQKHLEASIATMPTDRGLFAPSC